MQPLPQRRRGQRAPRARGRARHVDVLVAVEPAPRQARVKAQRRERAKHVLVQRVVVAVDVVGHLRRGARRDSAAW